MSVSRIVALCLWIALGSSSALAQTSAPEPMTRLEAQRLARQLALDGRYRQLIDTLIVLPPDSLTAQTLNLLGTAHGAMQDLRLALRYLERAADADTTAVTYRLHFARALHQAGMAVQARQQYLKAIALDSTLVPALVNLGQIFLDERRYVPAAGWFEKALRYAPRDYLSLYSYGFCLVNLGKPDSAMDYLAASTSLNPSYLPAITLLASLQFKRSKIHEALRLYEKAAERHPFNAEVRYRAALCLLELEENEAALVRFRDAARLDSSAVVYLAHLGQLYYEKGKYDSAAIVFRRAVELDEDTPSLRFNLGLSLAQLDSAAAAIEAFQSSIAAYHPEMVGRAHKEIGALHMNAGRLKQARASYRKALQFVPGDLNARFFLAVTLDQLADYRGALEGYREFLRRAENARTQRRNVKFARSRLDDLRALTEK